MLNILSAGREAKAEAALDVPRVHAHELKLWVMLRLGDSSQGAGYSARRRANQPTSRALVTKEAIGKRFDQRPRHKRTHFVVGEEDDPVDPMPRLDRDLFETG